MFLILQYVFFSLLSEYICLNYMNFVKCLQFYIQAAATCVLNQHRLINKNNDKGYCQ